MTNSGPHYGKKVFALGIAASQFGFMMAGGFMLGLWIDGYTGTAPWLALLGLILGFASGIRVMILIVKKSNDGDGSKSSSSES